MPHDASRYDCRGDARHEAHSLPSQLFDLILESWVRICHNAHWHDRTIAVHHRPNT